MILIFFCAAILPAFGQKIIRPVPIYFNSTPSGIYDPLKEKCCLGKVSELINGEWDKCCGNEVYNEAEEICCQDKINKLKVGYRCCGTGTYNVSNGICCDNVAVSVPTAEVKYSKCCGNQSYNSQKQLCCYDNGLQVVVEKTNSNQDGCCGKVPMNSKHQACCAGKVLNKMGNKKSCCGDKLINYKKSLCCNGVIFVNANGKSQCCGSVTINPKKQVCCYNGSQSVPVTITVPGANVCCGTKLYNYDNQICCNNSIYNGTYKTAQCCNGAIVNLTTGLCCYDSKSNTEVSVKKTDPSQDSCCGTTPYSSQTQICCKDNTVVKKKTPDANMCCGDVAYAYGKGVCCQNDNKTQFYEIENSYNYECCGLKPYTYQNQTCCNGTLSTNKPDVYCCNDKQLYNYNEQLCCVDYYQTPSPYQVYPMPKTGNAGCCGKNMIRYDNLNMACCRNVTYDYTKFTCCGDGVLYRKNWKGLSECCYYGTTDKPQCPIIYYSKESEYSQHISMTVTRTSNNTTSY